MTQSFSNIFEGFFASAKNHSPKTAIIYKDKNSYKNITYSETLQKSIKLGNILKEEYKIKPSDKIALCMENQPEFVFAFIGIMYANATAIPLDNQFPPDQVSFLLAHSDAKVFIVSEKIHEKLKNILKDIQTIIVDSPDFKEKISKEKGENSFQIISKNDSLAVLFYTSGTTSSPKAVMLSHKNLISNFDSINQLKVIRLSDVMISILPLHHAYAFTVTLLSPLFLGATIVYPTGIASSDLLNCVRETKTTLFVGVPQIFSLICRNINEKLKAITGFKKTIIEVLGNSFYSLRKLTGINLSKKLFSKIHEVFGDGLRYLVSGGARLDSDVASLFLKWGFTILEGYGLTETSPVATFNVPPKYKIGSIGKPLQGVEVKIVKENESSEVGEVAIKGDNVMLGYFNMEKETKEVIKDNWFYTGDLGYVDKNGYIFLTGRKKEMIVTSAGKNVYPDEVEKHYIQSPFIKEICVLNVKSHALIEGESLSAVVVVDDDKFKEEKKLGVRDRIKWEIENLSVGMPSYKRVKGFVISKEPLPKTRLGKIMRYKVKEIYETLNVKAQESEAINIASEFKDSSEFILKAVNYVQEMLKKPVRLDDHLELDLGIDSLGRAELLLGLQQKLNLKLSDDEAMEFFMADSVKALLTKLEEVAPKAGGIDSQKEEIQWDDVLNEEPLPETLEKINLRLGFIGKIVNFIVLCLIKVIFHTIFLLKVENKKNIKGEGPFIICPNHESYFDAFVLVTALPFKIALNTYFVGYSAIFENFIIKNLTRTARLITIDSRSNFVEPLKACAYVVKKGNNICYFPEGQRSVDGEIKDFKKGSGVLISHLDKPVIPVFIEGTYEAWPSTRKFPRIRPLKIKFGEIVSLSDLKNAETSKNNPAFYDKIAGNLKKKVTGLK